MESQLSNDPLYLRIFESKVIETFGSILSNGKLEVISSGNTLSSWTSIVDEKCGIVFEKDHETYRLRLFNPSDEATLYELGIILNLTTRIDMERKEKIERVGAADIDIVLNNYAEILKMHCSEILAGDFSFQIEYDKYVKNLQRIVQALGRDFSPRHPVYLKFINGDDSWRMEV